MHSSTKDRRLGTVTIRAMQEEWEVYYSIPCLVECSSKSQAKNTHAFLLLGDYVEHGDLEEEELELDCNDADNVKDDNSNSSNSDPVNVGGHVSLRGAADATEAALDSSESLSTPVTPLELVEALASRLEKHDTTTRGWGKVHVWGVTPRYTPEGIGVYSGFVPGISSDGEPKIYASAGFPALRILHAILSQAIKTVSMIEGCLSDSLNQSSPIMVFGFSRGGVVLNQLLVEIASLETGNNIEVQLEEPGINQGEVSSQDKTLKEDWEASQCSIVEEYASEVRRVEDHVNECLCSTINTQYHPLGTDEQTVIEERESSSWFSNMKRFVQQLSTRLKHSVTSILRFLWYTCTCIQRHQPPPATGLENQTVEEAVKCEKKNSGLNASLIQMVEQLTAIHFVDVGTNSRGAYLNDPSTLQILAQRMRRKRVDVYLHGTPYTWNDLECPHQLKEKELMVQMFLEVGYSPILVKYMEKLHPSLKIHFQIWNQIVL